MAGRLVKEQHCSRVAAALVVCRSKTECVVFIILEKQYEHGRRVDQPLTCKLRGGGEI